MVRWIREILVMIELLECGGKKDIYVIVFPPNIREQLTHPKAKNELPADIEKSCMGGSSRLADAAKRNTKMAGESDCIRGLDI
jgi:hypothetical protein